MPIHSDKQQYYPVDWAEITQTIKEGVDYECLECGQQCRRPGEPFDTQRRTLTVAHYDHDYRSGAIFLAALCTVCHLRHDRTDAIRLRRLHQRQKRERAGQLQFPFARAYR